MATNTRLDLTRYLTNSRFAHWGGRIAEKCGFSITRSTNTLKLRRMEVLSGLGIETVLDIGANTGQWARELRACGHRGRIISFEPGPSAFAQLEALSNTDQLHECIQAGLGDQEGKAQLIIGEFSENNSFRKQIRDLYPSSGSEAEDKATVPVRRLDSVLAELSRTSDRFYVKIDTQGFEREVLTGARETLKTTDAVEIELSLVELYEGQALLPEIWNTLVSAGLRPAWIERGYRDARDIWLLQIDGLFVREASWNC